MPKIDKHQNCPNCNHSWKGMDVVEYLRMMDVYTHKTEEELQKIAALYGWTKENPVAFSKAKIILRADNQGFLLQCPNCKTVYDHETADTFENLQIALRVINEFTGNIPKETD